MIEQHYLVIAALDQVTETFKKNLQNSIQFLAYTHASDFSTKQSVNINFHGEIFEVGASSHLQSPTSARFI